MNPLIIVKVGGSLLDWPDLRPRLGEFLRTLQVSARRPVLIVGGGGAADAVRKMDRTHGLGEDASHRLAVRALDLTARVVESLDYDRYIVVETLADCLEPPNGRVPILAPRRFLEEVDALGPDPLRRSWAVTSDSIAARVARGLGSNELILLKSADGPENLSADQAALLGLVDQEFPNVGREIAVVSLLNPRNVAPRASRVWFESKNHN